MSSLAAVQADGFYYPSDFDPKKHGSLNAVGVPDVQSLCSTALGRLKGPGLASLVSGVPRPFPALRCVTRAVPWHPRPS